MATHPGSRERLLLHGAAALGDSELLAVVLGTGSRGESAVSLAARILRTTGGVHGLSNAGAAQLRLIHGLGDAKASRVVASSELGRRCLRRPLPKNGPFLSSKDVDAALRPRLAHAEVEVFLALPLDARNRSLGEILLARGGLSACSLVPADAFWPLLRRNAVSVVFAHNHPSGCPDPSPEDVDLTKRLAAAGDLLGISVLDHVVVGHEGFFSFCDAGLLRSARVDGVPS